LLDALLVRFRGEGTIAAKGRTTPNPDQSQSCYVIYHAGRSMCWNLPLIIYHVEPKAKKFLNIGATTPTSF